MASPINFEQFKSNPIAAIAFVSVLTVGYLFNEIRTSHDEQLDNQNKRIEQLEERVEEYQNRLEEVNKKLIECLAVRNQ
jgi:chaperonin cofactor prefoldin